MSILIRGSVVLKNTKHSVVFLQVLHSRIVIIIITIIQHWLSLLLSACQFPAGLNDSQSASALQKVQYLLIINLKEGKHLVIRDRSGTVLWLIQIFKLGWCWVLWFTRSIALLCLHNYIPLIINECVMLLVDHNISLIQLWIQIFIDWHWKCRSHPLMFWLVWHQIDWFVHWETYFHLFLFNRLLKWNVSLHAAWCCSTESCSTESF